jgi:hypothetical protein
MKLTKKSSHKRIIEGWLEALESGTYKQTKNVLHRREKEKDSYCCLGVLCDLAVKAGVLEECDIEQDGNIILYDGNDGTLPPDVQEWIGLASDVGAYGDPNVNDGHSLAEFNDKGKKFKTIAKIIRSKPEGLFV